jgi:hypothetical protein
VKRPSSGPPAPQEPRSAAGKVLGRPQSGAALSGHYMRAEAAGATQLPSGSACRTPGAPRQPPGLDLDALRADPVRVESLPLEDLPRRPDAPARHDGQEGLGGGLAGDRAPGTVARTATEVGRLDLREYATTAQLNALTTAELVGLLERCGLEHERIAVVERGAMALVRDRVARQVDPRESDGDYFISVKIAAQQLGIDTKTIYRRRFPFVREVAPGTWRVSARALTRWMATRRRLDTC